MKIVNFCRLIGACLLSLLFSLGVSAQVTRTVKGVVSDGNEPLAGVSVIEIGTLNGTSTDVDGTFSLTVREGAKLEISFIGFATQEVSVIPGKTEYVITLKEDDVWLNEVVVVVMVCSRRSW